MTTKYTIAALGTLFLLPAAAQLRAAEDPPADPTLASEQVKAVSETVRHDTKVAVDAAKQGAEQVTATAKEVVGDIAAAAQEGAQELATTAKNGGEKVKAAVHKNTRPDKSP